MSKNKQPALPAAPQFQSDPTATAAIPSLYNFGLNAANFNFGQGGLSDYFKQAFELDPQVTQLALQNAQGFLQPQFNDIIQQIRNEAAANNQLESSTFTDALARNAGNLQSQYQGIAAGAALEDRNRALQNRVGLFGTGLNAIQSAAGLGLQNQGQQNQFNLSNYENQVAQALSGQKQKNGGFLGGLTGAIGGGLTGFMIGGPFGAGLGALGGGLAGGLGTQGTGGQFLTSGVGLAGSGINSNFLNAPNPLQNLFNRSSGNTYIPGQFAKNYGDMLGLGNSF